MWKQVFLSDKKACNHVYTMQKKPEGNWERGESSYIAFNGWENCSLLVAVCHFESFLFHGQQMEVVSNHSLWSWQFSFGVSRVIFQESPIKGQGSRNDWNNVEIVKKKPKPVYRPFPHYAPVSKHKVMRMRLGWTISYKSLYFVHPSLELVPLFKGMRERFIIVQ